MKRPSVSPSNLSAAAPLGAISVLVQQDRQLVDRCVMGEPAAWDELYRKFHGGLLHSIRQLFGGREWDANVVEEVAARVWYAVVANQGELLGRFDPQRGCRLATFLAAIARSQALGMFRAERRRRRRERVAVRRDNHESSDNAWIQEFHDGLTPREKQFLDQSLLSVDGEQFTAANTWQLRSRIRSKLRKFLAPDS